MIEKSENNIQHVAIIMDGNGRWAEGRAHQRIWGHIRGSSVVTNIVEEADDLGVKALTLYAFSTENWSRPKTEIKTLFKLLKKFLIKERKKIMENKIRFSVIGEIEDLPEATINLIKDVEQETRCNDGLKLTFAFGYGGRTELVSAVNNFIKENPDKEITEEDITNNLFQPDLGEVDLLIRTGGDQRISNFLLWQVAYAELYFTKTKWPDFKKSEFRSILSFVQGRERRFGNINSQESLELSTQLAKENQKSIGSFPHV
jgi:undecaprenyl diphosphate synthase